MLNSSAPHKTDPLPPQNLDAEESVLGAMMLSPAAVAAVREVLTADDFYVPAYGLIFDAALALADRGEPVDAITIVDKLRQRNHLAEVAVKGQSDEDRVRELAAIVPAAGNARYYAEIVRDEAARRTIIARARDLERLASSGADLHEISSRAEALTTRTVVNGGPRLVPGGSFVFDGPDETPAIWGTADAVLWMQGEALMIVGPDGVGKTTLVQQLALRRAGLTDSPLLDLPVAPEDERRVLYVAADRPQQARRSLARMVTPELRELMDERLLVCDGLLDFDLAARPDRLATFALERNAGTIVVDSLKDVALDLASDETGSRVARALQAVTDAGIEIVVLHHQRKGDGSDRPTRIADVYGSRWLTAKCGSVILLWGNPGDEVVKLRHLKQPEAIVGPWTLTHDHHAGTTTVTTGTAADADGPALETLVVAYVKENPGCTKRAVVKAIEGRAADLYAAIDEAVTQGLLRVEQGPRNAKHLYITERFPADGNCSEALGSARPGALPASASHPPFTKGGSTREAPLPEPRKRSARTPSTTTRSRPT